MQLEKIIWTEGCSVNNNIMDIQHKKILRLINMLIEHHNHDGSLDIIAEVLSEMTLYTIQHLADEEDLLKKVNYPHLSDHIKSHNKYRLKLIEFSSDITHDKESVEVLLSYLRDWWENHILIEDKHYSHFV